MPLPSELVTPPVTKTYFGIGLVIPPGFFRFYHRRRPMRADAGPRLWPRHDGRVDPHQALRSLGRHGVADRVSTRNGPLIWPKSLEPWHLRCQQRRCHPSAPARLPKAPTAAQMSSSVSGDSRLAPTLRCSAAMVTTFLAQPIVLRLGLLALALLLAACNPGNSTGGGGY